MCLGPLGLIPARAGKTRPHHHTKVAWPPHPRACGENPILALTLKWGCGSSPRVRGKPGDFVAGRGWHGLIPARAGKTRSGPPPGSGRTAHPRVCGENEAVGDPLAALAGSSPRVRGKPPACAMTCRSIRLIPACAGKTPRPRRNQFCQQAHPRVCGENVIAGFIAAVRAGSSPRVRGKRVLLPGGGSWARLIPACAGKTGPRREYLTSFGAHPRVCGENGQDAGKTFAEGGSSPRVRGKRRVLGDVFRLPGRIPARAGKTSSTTPTP